MRPNISGLTDSIGPQMQWNESDLAFLRRLCRRYDADLQMTGNELHLSPRKDVQRPPVVLNLHEELRSVRVIADLSQQTTQVTVAGWDHSNGSRIKFTSQGANRGPGGGTTGAEVLKRTFGVRSEHRARSPSPPKPKRRPWLTPASTNAPAALSPYTASPPAAQSCASAQPPP